MPRPSKLTPFHDVIGTVPDREISVMAGVSIATVCHYRQRWNIPSYRSTLTASAATAKTNGTAHSSPSGMQAGLQGFSVTIQTTQGRQQHITIANDIVSAARRASSSTQDRIVEIVHLGPAIGS
jgi:hypothetical protein